MFSHLELGSDPPIGSDRESGSDRLSTDPRVLGRHNLVSELR